MPAFRPRTVVCFGLALCLLASDAVCQAQTLLQRNSDLPQGAVHVYPIEVGAKSNILVTLAESPNAPLTRLYCNPNSGSYAWRRGTNINDSISISRPIKWRSYHANDNEAISISTNDVDFPVIQNDAPEFACAVVCEDAGSGVANSYSITAVASPSATAPVQTEQQALVNIYEACCNAPTSCPAWRAATNSSGLSQPYSNFCTFPGQRCSSAGNLLTLDLSSFNLNCSVPSTNLGTFTGLETLILSDNTQLRGNMTRLLAAVETMPYLQQLWLDNTAVTGRLDVLRENSTSLVLCSMARLTTLSVINTNLTGTLPACLLTSTTLSRISFAGGSLQGTIPALGSKLELFNVSRNALSGQLPSQLGQAPALVMVDASYNVMSSSLPAVTGSTPYLQTLELSHNQITGTLPSTLLTSKNMRSLDMAYNNLTGLHSSWQRSSSLTAGVPYATIDLSHNKLQGSFPGALAAPQQLAALNLMNNSLSGGLEGAVSQGSPFPRLLTLYAGSNSFSGPLPAQLQAMAMFNPAVLPNTTRTLDLGFNSLNGSIPGFINSSLPSWITKGVLLEGNQLDSSSACTQQFLGILTRICNQRAATASPSPTQTTGANPRSPSAAAPSPPQQSPSTVPSSPTQTVSAPGVTASSQGGADRTLSGIAIAAVVVGALLAVAIMAALIVGLVRWQRSPSSAPDNRGSRLGKARESGLPLVSNFLHRGDSGATPKPSRRDFERFRDDSQPPSAPL